MLTVQADTLMRYGECNDATTSAYAKDIYASSKAEDSQTDLKQDDSDRGRQ